ncbi:hypothetical protein FRC01_011876 [Tulasnella sp. 417]|nr:hypothetical protein FRC01_011876 [Tulasnella sp. 417]
MPEPAIEAEKGSSRNPERPKFCLTTLVKSLSKWRMEAGDLVFIDDAAQKKGGTADIVKATNPGPKGADTSDQNLETTRNIAVKKFRFDGDLNRKAQVASFANELDLLSQLRHGNIVELIGFVENAVEGIAWILLRWEDNGNLREFIHSQDWVIPERLSLIYDVACGLKYLHSRDPPICHGDLKSLNVLVTIASRAVITDFGSARKLQSHLRRQGENNVLGPVPEAEPSMSSAQDPEIKIEECGTAITLTGPFFTLRWAAPELLNDGFFSLASDMWAFAWICWEASRTDTH